MPIVKAKVFPRSKYIQAGWMLRGDNLETIFFDMGIPAHELAICKQDIENMGYDVTLDAVFTLKENLEKLPVDRGEE